MDFDVAKKRRGAFFPRWRRSALCSQSAKAPAPTKHVRLTPSTARTRFQACAVRLAKPWILSFIVVCVFVATVLNREADVADETWHCSRRRTDEEAEKLPVYSELPAWCDDRVTLMLNSFHRPDLMRRSIEHYSKCHSIVHQIRVIWSEEGVQAPSATSRGGIEIVYDVMKGTSLNNRFTPVEDLETEAVMSIDDDIYVPCSDIRRAFKVWEKNRRSLVGFFPRTHGMDENCNYEYYLGTKTYVDGRYSMLLTKAAVFHRDYLTIYMEHMSKSIRDYVDIKHNCEDIAMQLLIANFTTTPAKYVNSPWVMDSGKGPFKVHGISSDVNHKLSRTECLNDLTEMFDNVPLGFQPLNGNGETLLWIRLSPLISFLLNLFPS